MSLQARRREGTAINAGPRVKGNDMKALTLKATATAVSLVGALTLGALNSAVAAPALGNTAAVKAAVGSDVTDVQYRRGWRHRGGRNAAIAGFAAGTALGLGVAAASRPYYYDDSPSYAYDPYYYDSAPAYSYSYRSRGYSTNTPTY